MKFQGKFPSTDPVNQGDYKSKYVYSTFCPSVLFYSSIRVTQPSGLLPLKMKLIPAWWMIDQWSDRGSFQLWILRIPRGQRKWSSLTLSPLGTCLCSDGLWPMAACGYWRLTLSRCDSASGWQRWGSLRSVSPAPTVCGWTPTSALDHVSQKWKHIVRVAPRLPHISFSISCRFCAGCQNIQCKWCCFFLSFAPNVSTRNSLAAFRQIWRRLSRSGVPALPFNYERRTWYLGAVWLSKWPGFLLTPFS